MKKIAIALAAVFLTTAPVLAQNAPVATPSGKVYVGGSLGWGGTAFDDNAQWSASASVGYNVTRNIAVEAAVDHNFKNTDANINSGQTAFLNLVAGMPLGRITPYVLAGAGAGFNGSGDHNNNTETLWNVGGGLKYRVSGNWDLDARYRYIDAWKGERDAAQVVSLGVNYRF